MQRNARKLVAGGVGALVLGLAAVALANHRYDGTYELNRWGPGSDVKVTLWVKHTDGTSFDVVRQSVSGGVETLHAGKATLRGRYLRAKFYEREGAAETLANLGQDPNDKEVASAIYGIRNDGSVIGLFQTEGSRLFERGAKGADQDWPKLEGDDDNAGDDDGDDDGNDQPAGPVEIKAPAAGTYLAGQTLKLELEPADATIALEGPATQTADGIQLTGAGKVTITATKGQDEQKLEVEAVEAEVVEVEVLDALEIADAKAPHYSRAMGADEATSTPAAIFQKKPLRLRIKLQAAADLSEAQEVTLSAEAPGSDLKIEETVKLEGLENGQEITVTSQGNLNEGVDVNALDLGLKIAGKELSKRIALRVYTTYKEPINNISRDRKAPNTVIHFENACKWAKGATQNIGQGDSIPYNLDNMMRHYVHPKDQQGMDVAVPDYAAGAEAPENYDYLTKSADRGGGDWRARVRNGERPVSSLYYPPLNVKEDFEDYSHYRNNYGWWVLDNPTHVGGRCNQQASLVCGIAGTVGIKGEVLYLHRYGRGKKSGRPVRQYFYSNDYWPAEGPGGGPWNFHGVALLTLEDGSQWIYDGSFSSPPNRKNGTREWAENGGGPFIKEWGPWLYDDGFGGRVDADDIPDTWNGVQPKADEGNSSDND